MKTGRVILGCAFLKERNQDEKKWLRSSVLFSCRSAVITIPFEKDGERGDDSCSDGVAVNHEDVVAHALVERHLSDDVHSGVAELQRDHGKVGF